jgi:type II secretory pathway component PulF
VLLLLLLVLRLDHGRILRLLDQGRLLLLLLLLLLLRLRWLLREVEERGRSLLLLLLLQLCLGGGLARASRTTTLLQVARLVIHTRVRLGEGLSLAVSTHNT